MVSSLREIFEFSRAETIALCILTGFTVIGAGILVVDHYRQSLPPQLIIESLTTDNEVTGDESVTGTRAAAAELRTPSPSQMPPRSLTLNVNSASVESLRLLPYIGAALAQRIVDYRDKHGPFDSVGQLLVINGIGKRNLEKLRPYLTCQ